MPDLLIPDLDDALHASLQARAQAHHRSLADEARETLRNAVARNGHHSGETIVALASRLFGPEHGVDLELPSRAADSDRPPPDFSGPEYDR